MEKKNTQTVDKDTLLAISEGMGKLVDGFQVLSKDISEVREMAIKNADEIHRVKTGDQDAFKREAKPEDVERVAENRKGIDPRIITIVDELLGTDFGIEIAALEGDRIGYMLTLVVPDRLNDNPIEQRPILEAPGVYKKDAFDHVLMENYKRPDRRSRMLASADGYSAIREHCERVRAYIHAYYASKRQPMPELRVK